MFNYPHCKVLAAFSPLINNANIWFNKQCLSHKICLNYVKIKVSGNSIPVKKTYKLAVQMRIKFELKCLYKKKQTLNHKLYTTWLETGAYWNKV